MNVEALPRVTGEVTYLPKMAEKPHTHTYDLPPGQPRTNMAPDNWTVPAAEKHPRESIELRTLVFFPE